jgi:predicted ribosome quality control (RQC) complex YloA/Tae2 family protein
MDAMSLLALVEDARRALTGALVRGVYPAGSSGLWMELVTTQGVESVLVSADETLPRIVRGTDRPPRVKTLTPFVGLARRVLPAARWDTIDQRGLERVVTLEFGTLVQPRGGGPDATAWAELFGSSGLFRWTPPGRSSDGAHVPATGRTARTLRTSRGDHGG